MTRRPRICDHKPVVVEVALARFKNRGSEDDNVQCLRFANRVPLQFDKAACAITKAIESVNWRSYGLNQSKNSVPNGPYVFAVSVVSPFIKFKNASKETIDASDELVEEIRRALIQAGQKLGRHIRAEFRAEDLERKLRHLEQFGPMLVEGLVRILGASDKRRKAAEEGLTKILGRDTTAAEQNLAEAEGQLKKLKKRQLEKGIISEDEYAQAMSSGEDGESSEDDETFSNDEGNEVEVKASSKGKKSKTAKKAKAAKKKVAQKSVAKKKTSAKPARNKK